MPQAFGVAAKLRQPLLHGKAIVVIGGTSGLGLSAVKAFIAAGAHAVAVGRDPTKVSRLARELGSRAKVISADAAVPETASQAITQALEHFDGFDGLYHVAGGSGRRWGDGPLHDLTDEGWRLTLEWNLTSVFYSNRAAVRQFLAQKTGGSILNMGSVLGWSPSPFYFGTQAYATAKAAIVGLTKSCAALYADKGIRFNVLAPGLVETPMAARARHDQRIMRFVRTKQPLEGGRIGAPSDLDAAAVYFMSDDSKFTTGQVLAVDGGWCVSEGQLSSGK